MWVSFSFCICNWHMHIIHFLWLPGSFQTSFRKMFTTGKTRVKICAFAMCCQWLPPAMQHKLSQNCHRKYLAKVPLRPNGAQSLVLPACKKWTNPSYWCLSALLRRWGHNSVKTAWALSLYFPDKLHLEQNTICRPNYLELPLLYRELMNWSTQYVIHLYSRSVCFTKSDQMSPECISVNLYFKGQISVVSCLERQFAKARNWFLESTNFSQAATLLCFSSSI